MHTASVTFKQPTRANESLLTTQDPRALGAMHLAVVLLGLFASTLYALLAQAVASRAPMLSLAMVRAHGVLAVFLAVLPAIPSVLGNLLLPPALGRRELAMPRVGRAALRLHALGLALLLVALQRGASGQSWTLFEVYSAAQASDSVLWLVAAVVALGLSNAAVAMNLLVTVHASSSTRSWRELPPLAWGLYASSVVSLVVTSLVVALGVVVLSERTFGVGLFDPALGGDPLLFAHGVWMYLHPTLLCAYVAALGVAAHLLEAPTETRRATFGLALVGLGVVGIFGYGQHLYHVARSDFAVLLTSVAAVSVQAFYLWILRGFFLALRRGVRAFNVPSGYALAVVAHLAVVAPTSLVLALPATGVAYNGTTFVTGNLHYLAAGGVLFALLGGVHAAWRDLTGRTYDDRRATVAMGLLVVGVNASFLAMLQQGARGLARPAVPMGHGSLAWRVIAALGGVVTLVGLVLVAVVLARSLYPEATEAEG